MPDAALLAAAGTVAPTDAGVDLDAATQEDDALLIVALKRGDADAVTTFFQRYAAHVQRVLARILGADPDLKDLHHDVFLKAMRSIPALRSTVTLRGWITTIAIFTARTHIRARTRRRWLRFVSSDELPEVPASSPSGEIAEALRCTYQVLDQLPADERIAFALRIIDGMELTEVAEACGVSLATLKRRLARAEQRFVGIAREHPVLSDWLEGGTRWGDPTRR